MWSEDIVNTQDAFIESFGTELSDNDKRLPINLQWNICFIAGSGKCTRKQLSILLTKIQLQRLD